MIHRGQPTDMTFIKKEICTVGHRLPLDSISAIFVLFHSQCSYHFRGCRSYIYHYYHLYGLPIMHNFVKDQLLPCCTDPLIGQNMCITFGWNVFGSARGPDTSNTSHHDERSICIIPRKGFFFKLQLTVHHFIFFYPWSRGSPAPSIIEICVGVCFGLFVICFSLDCINLISVWRFFPAFLPRCPLY